MTTKSEFIPFVTRLRVLLMGLTVCTTGLLHAGGDDGQNEKTTDAAPAHVEFFQAIEEGKIQVRVVPASYAQLTMQIQNTTNDSLQIALPDTFAAVPTQRIIAQRQLEARGAPASLSNIGKGLGQGGGNSQGLGGSLSGPWWGNSLVENDPPGTAVTANSTCQRSLSIAPRRSVRAQIPCFCLEFGNPDPHSRIPYTVCPLKELNNRPAVAELLSQFVSTRMNQFAAQLAVWHLANDAPWQMLSRVQFPRTRAGRAHRVSAQELYAARQIAESLIQNARQESLGRSQ